MNETIVVVFVVWFVCVCVVSHSSFKLIRVSLLLMEMSIELEIVFFCIG